MLITLSASGDKVLSSGGPATSGAAVGGGGWEVATVNAVAGRSATLDCTVRLEQGEELDLANKHWITWSRVSELLALFLETTLLRISDLFTL